MTADKNGWMPIETAPKNGTAVLLFGQISKDPYGLFSIPYPIQTTGYWDALDDSWCVTTAAWDGPFVDATHWRELPPPPDLGTEES